MANPYLTDPDVTLYHGDALETLRGLPDGSVHMCATSPPFFGLRDYGTGTWEGGDADCDHRKKNPESAAEKSTLGPARDGLGPANQAHQTGAVYAGNCGKCGARRIDRQIGLEATPQEWVDNLVNVFREVRRVLRDDGTLWVEIGDSFAGSWGNQGRKQERGTQRPVNKGMLTPVHDGRYPDKGSGTGRIPEGATYKPKDLLGQPWLLAFALRADGWYLRSEIIWARPNPMPESVTDRPTKSHSTVFLLSKKPRYFWDQEAVREQYQGSVDVRDGRVQAYQEDAQRGGRGPDGRFKTSVKKSDGSVQHRDGERWPNSGRNIRSVWTIDDEEDETEWFARIGSCRRCGGLRVAGDGSAPTTGTDTGVTGGQGSERHIAPSTSDSSGQSPKGSPSTISARTPDASIQTTLSPCSSESTSSEATPPPPATPARRTAIADTSSPPETLIDALAGAGNVVCVCGTERERDALPSVWRIATEPTPFAHFATWPQELVRRMILAGSPKGGTVLDPFGGSGTTALVARKHGRRSILIELNAEYCALTADRLAQQSLLTEGAA